MGTNEIINEINEIQKIYPNPCPLLKTFASDLKKLANLKTGKSWLFQKLREKYVLLSLLQFYKLQKKIKERLDYLLLLDLVKKFQMRSVRHQVMNLIKIIQY